MNLPGSRLLEVLSKGMLSETSQLFLWTHKGLRFIYCFKELVVSSLERREKLRGNICTAVLTFEMPSMFLLSWLFISQHKGRYEGPAQLPRQCVQSWVCFICVVKRLVWEWAGNGGCKRFLVWMFSALPHTSCDPSTEMRETGIRMMDNETY